MNIPDNMKPYMNLSRELLLGSIEGLLYKKNNLLKKNKEYADTLARLHRSLKSCSVDSPDKGTIEPPDNYAAILDNHQQVIDSLQNTLTMIAMANAKVRGMHPAEPDVMAYTLGKIDTAKGTDSTGYSHHQGGTRPQFFQCDDPIIEDGPIIKDDSREEPDNPVQIRPMPIDSVLGGYTEEKPEFEVDPDVYSHIAVQIDNEAQKPEWFRAYPYADYMPNAQVPSQQHYAFEFTDFPDGWLSKYPDLNCILGKYGSELSDGDLKIISDIELKEASVRIAP